MSVTEEVEKGAKGFWASHKVHIIGYPSTLLLGLIAHWVLGKI